MTRYERKLYFERLLALREAYRADARESTGMTIEQAMRFAEHVFNDAADADLAQAAVIETALTKAPKAD
jgi:20S proteasome alpha/beta subunit